VILEGRVWSPDEVKQAYEYGAFAVVVGSAITRPQLITKRFVNAIPQMTKA
jgi:N-acylglucosamine-6-phosphate 2-epimerase